MTNEEIISSVSKLQSKTDLLDLLNHIVKDELGDKAFLFTMKQLDFYCNPNRRPSKRYHQFTIPKKSGGKRIISAPCKGLKNILYFLNKIFQAVYEPTEAAMGFVQGRSVKDNAAVHVNSIYVFNTDLTDFFPSIKQARIWSVLQLPPFSFNQELASMIAGLCCMKGPNEQGILPQGSPCSPVLTNLVCRRLDRRLLGLASRLNLKYTRYADDMTFSSMYNVYQDDGIFMNEFRRILDVEHFTINEKKTRLQKKGSRQEVTGLVVNERVNVSREYVRHLKSILYIWSKYGYNDACNRFYKEYLKTPQHISKKLPKMEDVIQGQLMYLKQIKGENSPVFQRLLEKFVQVHPGRVGQDKENIHYIFWSKLSIFEDNFFTSVKFLFKPKASKNESLTMGEFSLYGKKFELWITPRCDKVIMKHLESPSDEHYQKIQNFYVCLAERNGYKFWLMMKDEPKNYHKGCYTDFKSKTKRDFTVGEMTIGQNSVSGHEILIDQTLTAFVTDFNFKILEEWQKTKNN